MRAAENVLARAVRRKPAQERWLWLLTDGRTPDMPARPIDANRIVIVDFERDAVRLGRCALLARQWDAQYSTADDLVYGLASYQRGV
jgi:magnesium chelatase subunit ChlD-like protein